MPQSSYTLNATTATLLCGVDQKRKSLVIQNTSGSLTVTVADDKTDCEALRGSDLYPYGSVAYETGYDDPTRARYGIAQSGAPVVKVAEEF